MSKIIRRLLNLSLGRGRSAFLWGPRRTGKTYWLSHNFVKKDDDVIDLLKTDVFAEYAARPALLRERWTGKRTVIDEVQKVPALLDEVHWLIENKGASFLLTGSSARKLRREHANLLAGRALRFEMGPLSCLETEGFDLPKALRTGLLPPMFLSDDPDADLRSYVNDYLKEEVVAEATVRELPVFTEFLRVAALTSSEILNFENVARETGTNARAVRAYFGILEDTLLGFRLNPWLRSKTRRMIRTPKFYLFDVGVANRLARRVPLPGGTEFGKSFEHYVLMEILNFRRYREPDLDVTYWRASTGQEVDFILGDMRAAIEVKGAERVHEGDLRGLATVSDEFPSCRRYVVSLERVPRNVNGVTILPWREFVDRLYAGEITK
jgi:predicted AAA+ superfamily ATPase